MNCKLRRNRRRERPGLASDVAAGSAREPAALAARKAGDGDRSGGGDGHGLHRPARAGEGGEAEGEPGIESADGSARLHSYARRSYRVCFFFKQKTAYEI